MGIPTQVIEELGVRFRVKMTEEGGLRNWNEGGGYTGTHSFRKVLTAIAAPWGAVCNVVASARWPCS